ncbi:hypothetical protein DVH05_025607 [Phytophthora capsici]|nr:hypothetical protein DVH05_025607 [Phytophthora capsici]|eukprot:jgi/Phyca11/12397/fgenesh1_pm.PHYCAscaffold_113_\
MGKELTAEQKVIVKMYVTRGVAEGIVKCNYCEKEISSPNVGRWASHLRGCVKTPEDIKAQIQPFNGAVRSPTFACSSSTAAQSVLVSKDYMKFNATHFIAYKGFREKLHGHNYRLAVTITGEIGSDGYVIAFDSTNVNLVTEDSARFSFPNADCSVLPIVHSSAEELAIYIVCAALNQLVDAFTLSALLERGVRKIEVSISEANPHVASYERTILA